MKVSLYESGGRLEGGYTIPGMTLTGPLLLSGVVSSPTEAVHKQYVDTAVTNLDAANFVSGTIATARMPGLTGDITTNNGGNVVALTPSGVIAGDYTKVTVDAKGRVTNGLSLTESDLPSLSWGKITTNKPNTLAGYGITDGVSLQNGVLSGPLTLVSDPTDPKHAVTKQYAEANAGSGAKLVTGDIITSVNDATPSNFLRCNGGQISKTTYAALYAVVGDTFTPGNTQPGSGLPWAQQYQFNNLQANDLTGWASAGSLPATLGDSSVIVTKNRIYLLGGYNGAWVPTVYTAPINADGTIGSWTTSTSLPISLGASQVIVTKNRVYLMGGYTTPGNTAVATVYTAPINADGTLGTWTNANNNLPVTVAEGRAIATTNRVYVVGGASTGRTFTAPINADGTLGAWVESQSLPVVTSQHALVITKNYLHCIGGSTGNVYSAVINTNGVLSDWVAGTSLYQPRYKCQVVVTKNRIYLIGGNNNPSYIATTISAPINADGTIGSWVVAPAISNLPATVANAAVVVTSSRVYTFGGMVSGAYGSACYSAAFAGGLNDYSVYFNGSITATDTTNFKLPDYSSYEKTNSYFFIKT